MTKILIDRAVVEQVLDALGSIPCTHPAHIRRRDEAYDALEAALAEPVQEPVAWSVLDKRTKKHWYTNESKYTAQHYANECSHSQPDGSPSMVVTPLYTHPPRRVPEQEPVACAWHGDEDGTYETSCKHIFQMIDGTPHENNFTHCCFCGKSLVQHQWEDGNDE